MSSPSGSDSEENDFAKTEDYNLIPKMMPYLDRHMLGAIIPDDTVEAIQLKFELLKTSNMMQFLGELERDIKDLPEIPKEYDEKTEQVLQRKAKLEEKMDKLLKVFDDPEESGKLRDAKAANVSFLKIEHGITDEMIDGLFELGKFRYECADYFDAANLLYHLRVLHPDQAKQDSNSWGILACEILSEQWENAVGEIQRMKETIALKNPRNNERSKLDARAWLVHWSLYPLFKYADPQDRLIELFFEADFINTIQTICPWILRYLTAAVITNRKRSRASNNPLKYIKELVKAIRQESYEYSDPITSFVRALLIDFDFDEAQKQLTAAEQVIKDDYFLVSSCEEFIDASRHLIFECYCKIHKRIDISDLSTSLGLSKDDGEKWIVNLIRDTKLDAKIDAKAGTVSMNQPASSVYQQIIEKTKGGFFRTQVISGAVAR